MKSYLFKRGFLVSTIMLISTLTIVTFVSCDKEGINNNPTGTNDNYYVKYIISSSYPSVFSNWSVNTPQGTYTKNNYQTRHWEQTYGPVKKGFKCEVQVERGYPTIEIYVSKSQEPFALKTTKEGQSASYIIDF